MLLPFPLNLPQSRLRAELEPTALRPLIESEPRGKILNKYPSDKHQIESWDQICQISAPSPSTPHLLPREFSQSIMQTAPGQCESPLHNQKSKWFLGRNFLGRGGRGWGGGWGGGCDIPHLVHTADGKTNTSTLKSSSKANG